ncbi:MAG: ABC transporter ATPase [Flavobacteriales bacterium]|nr:ABC transporter ATPase [Flavobacteriales bacterium]MCB9448869.1 ABC transporter ATPase [Flavobacteriales bacterium]
MTFDSQNTDHLPGNARVWIFQAGRALSADEQSRVDEWVGAFLRQWDSHGAKMDAAYLVIHDRFLILFADESSVQASGCSIDKIFAVVQKAGVELGVDFLDKKQIAYRDVEGQVTSKPMSEFRKMLEAGDLGPDTIVFNNLVNTKDEFLKSWEVPMRESWHAQWLEGVR